MVFVCPFCRTQLRESAAALTCSECGGEVQIHNGIVRFGRTEEFFGELSREAMQRLISLSEETNWRSAVEDFLPQVNPRLISTIDHPSRLNGIQVAGLDKSYVVLDYGCGLGGVCAPLSRRCAKVVAVDGCFERLKFVEIRKRQDRLENLSLVLHGDVLRLPFQDDYFDLVILNLILPYLPPLYPKMTRDEAEITILKEFRRILKPGGKLYLAERNKLSISCLFRLMLPKANRESHSKAEYDNLLRRAGFCVDGYHWLLPDYKTPETVIDLSLPYQQLSKALDKIPNCSRTKRAFFKAAARVRSHSLAHTFGIIATA